MANSLIGNSAVATHLYQAFYGQAPSNALYNSYLADMTANGQSAFAATLASNFSTMGDAALALRILTNLGITAATVTATGEYTKLLADLTTLFAAYPTMRGQVILNATNLFANLESDHTYGAAAATYNNQALANFTYANNTANTAPGTASIPDPIVGSTFTLTTGADTTFAATERNDSFVSLIGLDGLAANGTTFNAGDVLDGKGGTDSLSVSISGTNTGAVNTTAVTMSNIENVSVSNYQTADANDNTINFASVSGVSKISLTSSASTGDTFFTNVRAIVTAEMANGAGDLGISYSATAVAGAADAQTLNLSGQTGGEFTTNDVETLTIASGTAANTVKVTGQYTGITVTGDQNLTLTEGTTNTLTSVNAAALTGKLAFTTDDVTAIAVTGGSGNDTVTLGSTFTAADTVDGGAGADSLSVAVTVTSATLAKVSNVETLVVTGGNSVTLATNVSPTTFTVSDASASTVTFSTGYTAASTVNLGVTDSIVNSANVALTAKVTAANAVSGAGISITGGTGTDALNITADGSAAFSLANLTKVDSILVVDGGDATATAGKDISITTGAYATALTVDASALDAGVATATDTSAETLTLNGASATAALNVTGGAGGDTITGGTVDDILAGGAGDDSINGSAGGNDSISAGDGDDTIDMGAALTTNDTIDGGAGTDILSVTALTVTGLTNVTNIETLSLAGASSTASLAANLSFTTIDMDTVDDTAQILTLASGYTNATTVLMDATDKIVNSANVAMTASVTAANAISGAGISITGGSGTDTLNIKATGAAAFTLAPNVTKVDVINVVDGGDATATAGKDISITTGAYATALTVDASALDAGVSTATDTSAETLTFTGTAATAALNVTGGAGGDTIYGGTVNDILNGGAGNDTLVGTAGGFDSISGGDGKDTIDMSVAGSLTYQDTISGGAGTDTLKVANGEVDINFMNVSAVETLTITTAGTTTLSSYAQAAGIVTINGLSTGGNTINAAGMTTGVTMVAGTSGNDVLTGGTAADTFTFSGTGLTVADTVAGGSSTDIIFLNNAAAGVSAFVDFDTVTSVESFTLGTASGADATTAETISLDVSAAITLTTAQTISLDGSVITDILDTITIVNGNASTTTKFNITGGAGADTLAGGAGKDTISGGAGADSITAGLGADVLTGGAGNDIFVFGASDTGSVALAYNTYVIAGTILSTTALDKITDFAVDDRITTTVQSAATSGTNAVGYAWTALSGFLRGTYDATAQTFTFSATGADSLFAYDGDNSNTTDDLLGVVLVGYVDTGTLDTLATGLLGVA